MQVVRFLIMAFMVAPQCTAAFAEAAISYGPEQRMTGVYFTNFENSVFTECSGERACKEWVNKDSAWADCTPASCSDLKARISRLNGSLMNNGEFAITFVGRRGPRHAKHFLNDRESTVLIEKVLDLTPLAK